MESFNTHIKENLMIYRAEGDPRKKKFVVDSRLHDIVQKTE